MVSLLLAATLNVAFTVTNDTAVSRHHALVATELPLPAGAANDPNQLRVTGYDQLSMAAQISAPARWPDGTVKTVRALFTTDIEPGESKTWTLTAGISTTRQPIAARVTTEDGVLLMCVGKMLYRIGDRLGPLTVEAASGERFIAAPPEREVVEENGPVRATARRDGCLMRDGAKLFRYTQRYSVIAGQPAVRVTTRLETAPGDEAAAVKCVWLAVHPAAHLRKSIVLGMAGSAHTLAPGDTRRLEQPVVSARLISDRQHPGWIDFRSDAAAMLFAVKDFWKRAPKALDIQADGTVRCELHSAAAPPLRLTPGTPVDDEFILWFHAAGESFDDALVEMNQPLRAVIQPAVTMP